MPLTWLKHGYIFKSLNIIHFIKFKPYYQTITKANCVNIGEVSCWVIKENFKENSLFELSSKKDRTWRIWSIILVFNTISIKQKAIYDLESYEENMRCCWSEQNHFPMSSVHSIPFEVEIHSLFTVEITSPSTQSPFWLFLESSLSMFWNEYIKFFRGEVYNM